MGDDAMRRITEQASVIENEYVRGWKGEGKKVVGFACIATPVEVIEAAGLLPYRLTALGNPSTEIADAYLSRFNCGFCRSLLQLGLDGTYDFLDGLIETNGCDHLRGMFENWQYVKTSPFFHYLKVPHITTDDALDYFRVEVRLFKEAIEKHFGVEIKDDDLWRAIENQDKVRERLRKVFAMREGGTPPSPAPRPFRFFSSLPSSPPRPPSSSSTALSRSAKVGSLPTSALGSCSAGAPPTRWTS